MGAIDQIRSAVESQVDVTFNAWLSIIILCAYLCLVRNRGLLLIAVLAASTAIVLFDTTSTWTQMIKVMAELPLGLGSVLLFLIMSRSFQARHLGAFTAYVNFAVYGNIGMMVATPSGGTIRGQCCRAACVALFIWILQQGHAVRWQTVKLHSSGLFVFTAVSKSWVLAHAAYRFVLLTLPVFRSGRRHRLLEMYSLGTTFLLSKTTGLPFAQCFGQADTLIVPATAGWSAIATIFDLLPSNENVDELRLYHIRDRVDIILSLIPLIVSGFAMMNIIHKSRARKNTTRLE